MGKNSRQQSMSVEWLHYHRMSCSKVVISSLLLSEFLSILYSELNFFKTKKNYGMPFNCLKLSGVFNRDMDLGYSVEQCDVVFPFLFLIVLSWMKVIHLFIKVGSGKFCFKLRDSYIIILGRNLL